MSTVVGVGPDRAVVHPPGGALASRVMVLLFTDVAGSTQLKEKLGMPAYARLISRHDSLFKSIADALPGAEILQDTGDGFLARFATPSDAVTAALRFQLALVAPEWGDTPLRVRVGLHLGQMTELEPTPRAGVAGGQAKVVGVGADMASRVMRLAIPGQILMTRAAFDEARQYLRQHFPADAPHDDRRHDGQLDDGQVFDRQAHDGQPRGNGNHQAPTPASTPVEPPAGVLDTAPITGPGPTDTTETSTAGDGLPPLEWVAHGRYVITGHDEPIEVFEVGVRGRSPLVAPPDGEKARRAVSFDEEPMLGWRPAVGREIPRRSPWTLQRPLGHGAFGEVWLARHPRTKDRRVFKFCFDPTHLRSLKRELTLFRLLHEALGDRPDVAKLHEVQLEHPPFFLESEFSELGSLNDWTTTRGGIARIPLATRLDLVARAAEAAAAAHSVGILHKDIKPANILIYQSEDRSPRPRLADFGIAALTDPSGLSRFAITVSGLTRSLLVGGSPGRGLSGTPMYQPPELEAGKPFTTQGDVYALGVLLYQMVVGDLRRPLAEGWERDVDDPLLREDIAASVEGDPARRLATAAELARRLRDLDDRRARRAALESAARASARRRRLYRISIFASMVLVLLLLAESATSTWYIRRIKGEQKRTQDARTEAERNLSAARDARTDAQQQSLVAMRQLSDAFVRDGAAAMEAGDPGRALLWFAEAMEVDQSTKNRDPEREAMQRIRIGMTIRAFPRLLDVPPPGDEALEKMRGADTHGGRKVMAFNDKRRRVYTARMVDAVTEKETPETQTPWPMRHEQPVDHCSLSSDGLRVATASRDRTARVWDAKTGRPLTPPLWHENAVKMAAFLPDAPHILVTATDTGTPVRMWDLSVLPGDPANTRTLRHAKAVVRVEFSRDGTKVLTASWDGTARVWDPLTGAPITPPLPHDSGGVLWAAFSPDGQKIVTAGDDGTARVWSTADGSALLPPLRHDVGGAVVLATFSPDGTKILTAGNDGTARLWNAATGQPAIPEPMRHDDWVMHAVFTTDGSLVATGSRDGTAQVWDAATGKPVLPKPFQHPGAVTYVALSADRRMLATACDDTDSKDKFVRLWSTTSGNPMTKEPLRHDGLVTSLEFNPDGSRLTTASEDHGVRLWSTSNGSRGRFLKRMRHFAGATYATFSPDGSMVLSAGRDDAARLWEIKRDDSPRLWENKRNGRPLAPALPHGGDGGNLDKVFTAAFAPPPQPAPGESASGGPLPPRLAVTGGREGTARLWDLSPDDRPLADIKAHAELLASQHVDETSSYRHLIVKEWKRRWDMLRQKHPKHFQPNPLVAMPPPIAGTPDPASDPH